MKNSKKAKPITIFFKNTDDLSTYFNDSHQQVYDNIVDCIELAIEKKYSSAVPFIIKKSNTRINCLLSLEKKKWLPTLENIQNKFMEEEQYEKIENIKQLITKLNPK
jgi:hypothetical protein